jgi:hypothetical protein
VSAGVQVAKREKSKENQAGCENCCIQCVTLVNNLPPSYDANETELLFTLMVLSKKVAFFP